MVKQYLPLPHTREYQNIALRVRIDERAFFFRKPQTLDAWASEFSWYLRKRYEHERESWDEAFPDPESPEGQLERMADLATLKTDFDLNDSLVAQFFLEYRAANRDRLDAWRRFELVNGRQTVLRRD